MLLLTNLFFSWLEVPALGKVIYAPSLIIISKLINWFRYELFMFAVYYRCRLALEERNKQDLEKQRQKRTREETDAQVKALAEKKRRIMEEAKQEAEEISRQMEELKKSK